MLRDKTSLEGSKEKSVFWIAPSSCSSSQSTVRKPNPQKELILKPLLDQRFDDSELLVGLRGSLFLNLLETF